MNENDKKSGMTSVPNDRDEGRTVHGGGQPDSKFSEREATVPEYRRALAMARQERDTAIGFAAGAIVGIIVAALVVMTVQA